MKLCVFSDIHGNGPAFNSIYPCIVEECADYNIFLGDLCGYYYDQMEILRLLRNLPNLIAIKGNHDKIFLDILNGDVKLQEDHRKRYGKSMDLLLACNNTELKKWLSSCPDYYIEKDGLFSCFHGSPENPLNGYIYPDTSMDLFSQQFNSKYLLLGHTHYKMKRIKNDLAIINPGSIGQPRDRGWPSYVTIDSKSRAVLFKSVKYNKEKLRKQIVNKLDTNIYLTKILDR